jgi:hypothetical protein
VVCLACAEQAAAGASEVTEVQFSNPAILDALARHRAEQN